MTKRRSRALWATATLCLWLGLGPAGCHRPTPPSGATSPAGASTEVILVMLSEARAWQRRADLHLLDGDVGAAIAAIKEVLNIPFPADATEAEDVRLDACARLAKLYLGSGGEEAEERALAQLDFGRKGARGDSFFLAQLEMVTADVYEARAARLSDRDAKNAARHQAIAALERATQIDRRLQRALLNLPVDGSHPQVETK